MNNVPVNGGNYAFAIYQAPGNFVRQGHDEDKAVAERKITLKLKIGNNPETSSDIKLDRPPLLLIHGLWSGPGMWDGVVATLESEIKDFQIYRVSYESSVPLVQNINVPYFCQGDNIKKIKERFKNEDKIAITQVDVVGYSEGGLLARIWAGNDLLYARDDNFLEGDINKLITLDSPHYGSFLADFAEQFNTDYNNGVFDGTKEYFLALIAEYCLVIKDNGALADLTTYSNQIRVMNSKECKARCHSITGNYVVPNHDLNNIPGAIGEAIRALNGLKYGIAPHVLTSPSDLAVSVKSQLGGLALPASSTFGHQHTEATTQNVTSDIFKLLNADNAGSSFSDGFK